MREGDISKHNRDEQICLTDKRWSNAEPHHWCLHSFSDGWLRHCGPPYQRLNWGQGKLKWSTSRKSLVNLTRAVFDIFHIFLLLFINQLCAEWSCTVHLNKELYFIWSLHNILWHFNSLSIKTVWQVSMFWCIWLECHELTILCHINRKLIQTYIFVFNYDIIFRWLNQLLWIHYLPAAPYKCISAPVILCCLPFKYAHKLFITQIADICTGSTTTFVNVFLWFYSPVLCFTVSATYYTFVVIVKGLKCPQQQLLGAKRKSKATFITGS